jgi:uncharacterized RDD family membrane protein YckC
MSAQEDSLHYGGFWVRFAAVGIDILIMLPLIAVITWANQRSRLFEIYYFIPRIFIVLFYDVYLVRRFGGTPGKLIMRLRIRKVSGEPVGYREAILRSAPDFLLGLLMSIALLSARLTMTDAEFYALSFAESAVHHAPRWFKPLRVIQDIWATSEFIVLLTNRKRRALHDFIAGTVVVYNPKLIDRDRAM